MQRQPEAETTTRYFLRVFCIVEVLGLQPPLVRFDNAAAQIQADAHAFCLGGEKSLEQVAEHLFTQPIATIAQHELHHVFTVHAGVADIQPIPPGAFSK